MAQLTRIHAVIEGHPEVPRVRPGRRGIAWGLAVQALALGVTLGPAQSASPAPPAEPSDRPAGRLVRRSASVRGGMIPRDRWHLSTAFALALERVQKREACGDLFDDLSADAVTALGGAVYEPAQTAAEVARCRGNVHALTEIGGHRTRLCPGLRRLPRPYLAAVLIHESLHHAGMSEAPVDPQAPSSPQITAMVKKACSL